MHIAIVFCFFSGMTFFFGLDSNVVFFLLFINSVLSLHFFDVCHKGTLGLACLSNEPTPTPFLFSPSQLFLHFSCFFFFF